MKKAIAIGLLVIVLLSVNSCYIFPESMFKLAINAERSAAGLTKKEIQVDDHKIVYLEGGKGEAVLLLHGDLPPESVPHPELEFCHFICFQCSHASGAGGRYFNELCGLNVLYSNRHSSISTWASLKV